MKWLEETHGLTVSQAAISKTLKRSVNLLKEEVPLNSNAKRSKSVKYPAMESVLYEWLVGHQEHVNVSGELLKGREIFF